MNPQAITAGEPGTAQPAASAPAVVRPLISEWHHMGPQEQASQWEQLVDWVIWIHDLYELSREERLPWCWTRHPGLVEELRSLKAWRTAIYSSPDAAAAAHTARSWHGELRQTIAAATTFWAPACRAGHTDSQTLTQVAEQNPGLAAKWVQTGPPLMASAPPTPAPSADEMTGEQMAAALDCGDATLHSQAMPYYVQLHGGWWTRAQEGAAWLRCTDPAHHAQLDRTSAQMRGADRSFDKISREL